MFRKKSNSNSVYKYRYGDDLTFERDLNDLMENRFYAPSYNLLNDPCETLVFTDAFDKQATWFFRLIGGSFDQVKIALEEVVEKKSQVGIYSLSKTYKDELLWAHYANSHSGFCIEYDLSTLLEIDKNDSVMYSFPVKYYGTPPQITFNDSIGKDVSAIITKIAGTKSSKWSYEKEHRIILDQNGHRTYNYKALKSVYFGIRMSDERKQEIMTCLKGRGISYFQMGLDPKSYRFVAHPVEDIYGDTITYFTEIPSEITELNSVKFQILERNFYWVKRKATITIELESKVNEKSIEWLGNLIRKDLFKHADRIFMFYNVKGLTNQNVCWASSHFENGNLKVEFNDYSWME